MFSMMASVFLRLIASRRSFCSHIAYWGFASIQRVLYQSCCQKPAVLAADRLKSSGHVIALSGAKIFARIERARTEDAIQATPPFRRRDA